MEYIIPDESASWRRRSGIQKIQLNDGFRLFTMFQPE